MPSPAARVKALAFRGRRMREIPADRPWAVPDPRDEGRHWHLAICAVFKDEARYLGEWIEFHRLVGVEKFFLYNNNSTDDYLDVLAPHLDSGVVSLFDITIEAAQFAAYQACLDAYRDRARWVAFIDVDEFLVPVAEELSVVLADYEAHPALAVHWVMFATSGHVVRPDGLVLERYTRCQPEGNKHLKLIVDPARTVRFLTAHTAEFVDGALAVNERFETISGPSSMPPTVDRLRLNHYWTKSVEDYVKGKMERGRTDLKSDGRDLDALFMAERNYSHGEDRTIQAYLDRVKNTLQS